MASISDPPGGEGIGELMRNERIEMPIMKVADR